MSNMYTAHAFVDDERTGDVRTFEAQVEMYDNGGGAGDPAHSWMPEITGDIVEISENGDEIGTIRPGKRLYDQVKASLLADAQSQFDEWPEDENKNKWLGAETGKQFRDALETPWRK